jgi:hypothetical protein
MPEENELDVVKTREEMKRRERIAVEKKILRNKLDHEFEGYGWHVRGVS